MTIGDPAVFAIESSITKAYERISLRALGFFVIYLKGLCYGRRSANSTMLACSFDEVARRIAMRGRHIAPFPADADAEEIAHAFRNAIYGEEQKRSYFGIPFPQFREMIYSRRILWAPDGDSAFDDGSYVLQFDVGDSVRLVAFKSTQDAPQSPATITDTHLTADDFYSVLQEWHKAFENEWTSLTKIGGPG
ncbi:MAG TPA: Imm42 family immunity protein [Terriglobales bacterium]|nr:Imm42 family immunity protein [Terriglobales bacterium]